MSVCVGGVWRVRACERERETAREIDEVGYLLDPAEGLLGVALNPAAHHVPHPDLKIGDIR